MADNTAVDVEVGVARVKSPLARSENQFAHFLLRSAVVGVAAGLVAVAFRLTVTCGDAWREWVLRWAPSFPGFAWLVLPVAGAVAAGLAGWLTDLAPETAGGGIPQVEAVLGSEGGLNWWRVLPVKFLGGTLTLSSGLSLGPEGPAVQLGAAAGQAVSQGMRRSKAEELHLIACGAGAGLAAAFNAPLAGVVFVVEELRRNFSPYALGGALAASVTADIVSLAIVGPLPAFRVAQLQPFVLGSLPFFLYLGAATGILGAAFNWGITTTLSAADRLAGVPRWVRAATVGFSVCLVGYFLPQLLGGGHALVMRVLGNPAGYTLGWLLLLFWLKFGLILLSYGAGVPGGILLPLLTLGALSGAIVARGGAFLFPVLEDLAPSFVIIGMAAFFVAVVRSPLTGIVLLTEMTGRYQYMLPLLLTCIVAYMVAEACGSLPLYEALLQRYLHKEEQGGRTVSVWGGIAVVELVVESGSEASGRLVKDLQLPSDCLLVAVVRGTREEIPRGGTPLHEGDVLRVIAPEKRLAAVKRDLLRLTSCPH